MTKTESLQWTVAFRTSAFHAELLTTLAAEGGVTRSAWLRKMVEENLSQELAERLVASSQPQPPVRVGRSDD